MKSWFKKLHVWSLQWAKTKWGAWSLFICAFTDASFLPMPTPLFFLTLTLLNIKNAYKYALFATLGTLFGALAGYSIGQFAWLKLNGDFTGLAQFMFDYIPGFSEGVYNNIQIQYAKWDFWILFIASFILVPYKLFSISSGVFDINIFIFCFATLISQGIKFTLLALLIIKIGPDAKKIFELKLNPFLIRVTAFFASAIDSIKTFLANLMNWLKKKYDWVLKWAETPYGPIALFILAFTESIFFPIPPDVLLIALALGSIKKSFRYAINCTIGSILGAFVGYTIGHLAWTTTTGEFTGFATFFFNNIPGFSVNLFNRIKDLFNQWGFWVIFTAGFTPIPYKVFTITSGVFDINLMMFLIASVISRGARFFLIGFLIWKFGHGIKRFLEKYFNIVALGLTTCLIGGFVTIKYFL
jgi:membrane protein YqaA with SNARE-associated domain